MEVLEETSLLDQTLSRRLELAALRRTWHEARFALATRIQKLQILQSQQFQLAETLDLRCCSQEQVFEDLLIQRASAELRDIDRALSCMQARSYGICRVCRCDIAIPRLQKQPDATLCATCIEERLETLSADAL
ncbi:MAG: TraR/DksA C4-type zinc finger protein [Nitrospiraceae bacterium]|nr:TraR/DksA C4-type zinc finger protein [Nitrospiraceae bacterium]